MENIKQNEMNPQEYFNYVKGKKSTITDEELLKVYDNCLELLNKYHITGQRKAMRKLLFHMECIEKERKIVKLGINTFVYRDDVEFYIDNVAKNTVKIIDLASYEREIPDDVVDIIAQVKDEFDQLYIVFTDYTGEVERQVIKERRQKDPILFGVFEDVKSRSVIDRFYYIADWEDEYCDLTLDKMINETKLVGKRNIPRSISTPKDIHTLKAQLASLEEQDSIGSFVMTMEPPRKKSFFRNIQKAFGEKRKNET